MTIYEITGKYGLLMERLEVEGTDVEEVLSLFDDLKEDLKEKADGYGRVMANYKAQIDALRTEEKRLEQALNGYQYLSDANAIRIMDGLESIKKKRGKVPKKT